MSVNTPDRRRRIQQLVRNEHPSCEAVFMDASPSEIAFRIKARNGRYRSGVIKLRGVIKLLSHHGHIRLNSMWLKEEVSRFRQKRSS